MNADIERTEAETDNHCPGCEVCMFEGDDSCRVDAKQAHTEDE